MTSTGEQAPPPDEDGPHWARIARWVALGGALLAVALTVKGPDPLLENGTPAPALMLATLQGGPVDMSPFRGKPTVVNFFATWCMPCKHEVPDLNRAHASLGANVNIVGIAVFSGDTDEVGGTVEKWGIRYPVWISNDESAARWRVSAVPTTYFVDAEGIVRSTWSGPVDEDDIKEALEAAELAKVHKL